MGLDEGSIGGEGAEGLCKDVAVCVCSSRMAVVKTHLRLQIKHLLASGVHLYPPAHTASIPHTPHPLPTPLLSLPLLFHPRSSCSPAPAPHHPHRRRQGCHPPGLPRRVHPPSPHAITAPRPPGRTKRPHARRARCRPAANHPAHGGAALPPDPHPQRTQPGAWRQGWRSCRRVHRPDDHDATPCRDYTHSFQQLTTRSSITSGIRCSAARTIWAQPDFRLGPVGACRWKGRGCAHPSPPPIRLPIPLGVCAAHYRGRSEGRGRVRGERGAAGCCGCSSHRGRGGGGAWGSGWHVSALPAAAAGFSRLPHAREEAAVYQGWRPQVIAAEMVHSGCSGFDCWHALQAVL